VAARVLADFGVELDKVRRALEFIVGRGDRIILGEIDLTPRSKKVIELAKDEARRLNHHYIGTEHLLLGLVREGEGIAIGILKSLGVNSEKVRTQTIQVLSQSAAVPVHVLPPIPPEAITLVAEGDSGLLCYTCKARCPSYFTYCFHCGSRLKPLELE
jgi:ATP-dependent Clp protease ATP-binding subunit ClpA